ncbi:Fic family protein [Patescibacteria group bacterium]
MYLPKFTITQTILKNVSVIEACKEIIITSPLVPAWEKEFQAKAELRTIHFGTHLEGNELSLNQAKKVIQGEDVVARDRDVWEVINYRNVLKYLDKIGKGIKAKKPFAYNKSILKKMHELTVNRVLNQENSGKFRKAKVVIKNSKTGEVVFSPIPPVEVSYQIEEFFHWLNSLKGKQIHPVLRAGIAHLELVRIHPFIDGNGRAARAFATLVLFIENYKINKFFSLEEHFDKDPLSYYQALGSVTIHRGDLTVWLEYFTQVLAIELTQVREKVRKLSLDTKLKDKLGRQIALSERQIKLVEHLKIHDRLFMKEAKKLIYKVSEDTILRDLKDLIKKGIVKKAGKTKAASYILTK